MAKKKKISKSRRRRLLIMGTASIVAFVFFCINVFSYSYKIITLTKKQNDLAAQLDELKSEKEKLDTEIEKLQDEDYLARYARENYLYTKSGEYVIKIQDSSKELDETSDEIDRINIENKYIIYVSLACIGILVIISVVKKNKDEE